jgi:hypothetical protein
MPVVLVDPASLRLGEAAEPQELQTLDRAVQLGEVLLDPGIGCIGEVLGAQGLDPRVELAQTRTGAHRQHGFESRDPARPAP